MKPFRVSITASLGVIAVCALGFIGMREGKPLWASLMFCLTLAFLLGTTLTGLVGPTTSRPGPIGFALFGWVYLATVFGPWGKLDPPQLPQSWSVDAALERLHPQPEYEDVFANTTWQSKSNTVIARIAVDNSMPKLTPGSVLWSGDAKCFRQSAHSMGAIAFGFVGLLAARRIARRGQLGSA